MKYLVSILLIYLLIVTGCSNKETLNELKNENKQLKEENTKVLESNKKLERENAELLEANEELKNEQSTNIDHLPYPISTAIEGNSTPDLKKVATELFSDYLNYYKNSNGSNQQLKDFTIENLRIEKNNKSSFLFLVEFSVLPINADAWMAGNGTLSEDNWIHNKTLFVHVGIKDNTYTMLSHGTSP
ncbi:MAG: hypothetical protein K0R71_93 [Bacillales bacterium]|jgi:hypothetical protein|nr:hypothetical protein [Bacillales bacterium]